MAWQQAQQQKVEQYKPVWGTALVKAFGMHKRCYGTHRQCVDVQQADADADATATAWIGGFLRGSGLALLHHRELFDLLDTWLGSLAETIFRTIVFLLRRAFTEFSLPERPQIMDVAGAGPAALAAAEVLNFDWARGVRVRPMLRKLVSA